LAFKLIKSEPGLVDNDDEKHLIGVVGDADALGLAVFGVGLGAATEKSETIRSFTRTGTIKQKKAVLISV
jgi:hypothetical protein